ncbi:MAG: hypothetical protein ACOY81_06425 [Bacillota bacterium]
MFYTILFAGKLAGKTIIPNFGNISKQKQQKCFIIHLILKVNHLLLKIMQKAGLTDPALMHYFIPFSYSTVALLARLRG